MANIVVESLCDAPVKLLRVAEEAARLTLESQGQSHWSLGIALADDAYLRSLNRQYRNKDAPTDVLSFALWQEGDDPEVPLGDVVISLMAAARQAEERGHSLETELVYLVAHGVLHLLGWRDDSAPGEDGMWEIQEQIAAALQRGA